MTEQTILHCQKHDVDFNMLDGCPQCIAERLAEQVKKKLETETHESNIVKVRYFSEETGEVRGREYSYFSEDRLNVGDTVEVPVTGRDENGFPEDRILKAQVTAIDVPEAEIAAFRDRVKTIPAGSRVIESEALAQEVETKQVDVTTLGDEEPTFLELPLEGTVIPSGMALVKISPSTDPRFVALYQEIQGLLRVAQEREIKSNADLKPAADDLGIISKVTKAVNEERAKYVKPISEKLDLVRDAFKTLLDPLNEADQITRAKLKKFDADQKAKAAEAQRIEEEKLKLAQDEMTLKGEHTQELGTVEAPPAVPSVVRTDMATVGGRVHWKWRLVDFALVPDEYKLLNEKLLNSFASSTKGTREIPGIEIYEDKDITVRT